jgi:hypothetical protein
MTCKSSVLAVFVLAASSCIDVQPGTSVEVEVAAVSTSAPRAELVNDYGYHIQLEQMYLVLSRVELVPCPGAQRASILRELLGVSVAHAHGVNTMTAWAVPNVLAPLADTAAVSIAALHPPAIAYCSLRLALEAADADAERMPSEVDMNGLSMFVTGSYGLGESAPGVAFLYESFGASRMDLPIVDSAGNPAPIELSADTLNVRLRVEIAYQQLFDGLTLYPGSFSTFGDVVLGQALTHVRVVVQ